MRHDELARLTLRSLAYAELCADDVERDGREVLELLAESVERADGRALARMIDILGGHAPAAQAGARPPFLRGSMRYV
ncbi:MAG: hypothetical protein P8Y78_02840 [Acidihalobacter sp.]